MNKYNKIVKNIIKIIFVLLAIEAFLSVLFFFVSKKEVSILYPYRVPLGLLVIFIGCILWYISYKYLKLYKEMRKYSRLISAITNIVNVTAMNYFYANKMKRKFNVDKIHNLNKYDFQFAYIPDMLDMENEATEDEIKSSIQVMKDWNIGVIHTLLTHCLNTGYISGNVRRILIDHALSGINSINDNCFTFDRKEGDHEYYSMKLDFDVGTMNREVLL